MSMKDGTRRRRPGQRWRGAIAVAVLLVALGACGDDGGSAGDETDDTLGRTAAEELLGPADPASGEPVKVGQVSEGTSATVEAGDELQAGAATVEWLNEHRGGIGGRPIELVTCEMKVDPATTTDCAQQMIEEDVVAVTVGAAAYTEALWEPLHTAGIPLVVLSGTGGGLLEDDASTFVMVNPMAAFFGLPIAIAESEGADKVTFVIIDVPQARDVLEADDGATMERAGLDYDVVTVPLGTPDLTSQMQDVANSGTGVVHILGNDAFCIAAIQGLRAVGYDGAISGVSYCFTDATRTALGSDLEGISVLAPLADGATDDPTYQLYQAVMAEYGQDVEEVDGYYALSGYAAVATLGAALETIEGEIDAATVASTIRAMPETELPAGGGTAFRCGGSAVPDLPAVCTNQWLRGELDANGEVASYTVEDSSEVVG
jgi:ABC-type branched-subunit amino acid transport system substrate-binding protein